MKLTHRTWNFVRKEYRNVWEWSAMNIPRMKRKVENLLLSKF